MELCEGSLKDYFEEKTQIPKDALNEKIIISQMVLGLAYIHGEEIIHKDVKLANILLWRQSSESRLVLTKIADFGFAKELKPDQSEFSNTDHPGTERYMAPELLNAKDIFIKGERQKTYPATFASDVYALGITICRIALKGKHPFDAGNQPSFTIALMANGIVPPNLVGLEWDLRDLILKLTDTDPTKRPTMSLVLEHPYFVLTNTKTKKHFVDRIVSYFSLLPLEVQKKELKQVFNAHNFQEWYKKSHYDKPHTKEEQKKLNHIQSCFKKVRASIMYFLCCRLHAVHAYTYIGYSKFSQCAIRATSRVVCGMVVTDYSDR